MQLARYIRHCAQLALLLVLFSTPVLAKPFQASVKKLTGQVFVKIPGSDQLIQLKEGMNLKKGSTIISKKGGNTMLFLVPGAAVNIVGETECKLGHMIYMARKGVTTKRMGSIYLKKGTVSTLIKGDEEDVTEFHIITPYGSTTTQGAFYGITVKDEKMYTKVIEGYVAYNHIKDEIETSK